MAVFSGGKDFLIASEGIGGGFVTGFAERAVVDERADGDAVDELGDASGVVDVVVGEEDVVDVVEAGAFGGGGDAVGVAALIVGPACVDEERVVIGGDEERGLAAFDVDEEDLQVAGGVLGAEGGTEGDEQTGNESEGAREAQRRLHGRLRGARFLDRDIIDRRHASRARLSRSGRSQGRWRRCR